MKRETKYYIDNGIVKAKRFGTRNQSGKKCKGKIGAIIEVSRMTISDIARISQSGLFDDIKDDCLNKVANTKDDINKLELNNVVNRKKNIQKVLSGIRNTKRYIDVIEKVWGLPIEEIRRYYAEDKTREYSDDEILEFSKWYRVNRRMLG